MPRKQLASRAARKTIPNVWHFPTPPQVSMGSSDEDKKNLYEDVEDEDDGEEALPSKSVNVDDVVDPKQLRILLHDALDFINKSADCESGKS